MTQRVFQRFSKELLLNRKLFVPFITAGDRGLEFTYQAACQLGDMGVDAIELGIPFSDPLVDGKTIQRSYQRSLAQGTQLPDILKTVARIRKKIETPIILMGSINPFLQLRLETITRQAKAAGVDGIIIPDFPPEEAHAWVEYCRSIDMDAIFLTTPNSTETRLTATIQASSGYIYYVSITGTTGTRTKIPKDIPAGIKRVRSMSPLPILVGFGISTPEQAKLISSWADGVIVGSALVKLFEHPGSQRQVLKELGNRAGQLLKAVKN